MAEEVILTVFKAETGELDAALAKSTKGLDGLEQSEKDAAKAGNDLTKSLGSIAAKNAMVTESSARAAKSVKDIGTNAQSASGKVGIFQRISGSLSGTFNSLKGSATSFFQGVAGGLQNALPGVSGLGGAFSALTGPIGIAAAAVTGLVANFMRLDSVATFVDGLGIQLGFIGDRLANLDFSGLFDPATVARDTQNAQILANLQDQLQDGQLNINKANADAGVELAKLNNKLRDRTKTEEERLAIADEIGAIESKRSQDELKFIDARIAAQKFANAQQLQNLGEVNDENKAKLNELEVARANALASSIALQENVERRRNGIVEQGAAERSAIQQKEDALAQAAAAKAAAAREKAEQERKRIAQERAGLEGKIASDIEEQEAEALKATLSKNEQELFDIERTYDKRAEAAAELFAKLRKLAEQQGDTAGVAGIDAQAKDDAERIAADKARAVEAKTQEQLANERKIIEEGRERIADSLLTDQEREVQAVQEKYAKLLEENAKYYSELGVLTAEGEANKAALIAQSEADQKAITEKEAVASQEAQIERQTEAIGLLSDSAAQALDIVAQAAAGGQDTAEAASKALTLLALDTLEKLVLMNAINAQTGAIAFGTAAAGPAGTLAGIVQGAVVSALIKGLFSALKAQISGAYTGEEFISGSKAFPTDGKDQYLRRVHHGERIITADKNKKHGDILHAIHAGDVDGFIQDRYVLPAINAYMNGDSGQRMASSVMLAQYYDKNIVQELRNNREAMASLPTAIAAALGGGTTRKRGHRRMWAN